MTDRRVVLATCWVFSLWLTYSYGVEHRAKLCAEVPGQQVISTTADTCIYANAFGRATFKRRAG